MPPMKRRRASSLVSIGRSEKTTWDGVPKGCGPLSTAIGSGSLSSALACGGGGGDGCCKGGGGGLTGLGALVEWVVGRDVLAGNASVEAGAVVESADSTLGTRSGAAIGAAADAGAGDCETSLLCSSLPSDLRNALSRFFSWSSASLRWASRRAASTSSSSLSSLEPMAMPPVAVAGLSAGSKAWGGSGGGGSADGGSGGGRVEGGAGVDNCSARGAGRSGASTCTAADGAAVVVDGTVACSSLATGRAEGSAEGRCL